MASGGLTHFVVDEALDQKVLAAMVSGDEEALAALPENVFKVGHRGNQELVPGDCRGEYGGAQVSSGGLRAVLPVGSGDGQRDGVRVLGIGK